MPYLKITFYYVIFFALSRIAFFLLFNINTQNLLSSLVYGVRMDLAVVGYLLIPAALIGLIGNTMIYRRTQLVFHLIVFAILLLCIAGNFITYHYWQQPLNYRAVSYLTEPSIALASLSLSQFILYLTIILLILFLLRFILKKVFNQNNDLHLKIKIARLLVVTAASVIMIRGGLQMLPINESAVAFSNDHQTNTATLNPVWHLAHEIKLAGVSSENPFALTTLNAAKEEVRTFFTFSGKNFPALKTPRPNIVFLILESFTADAVGSLGGEKLSPNLDSLIANGLLFDSVYSTGSRTDQGIVSILNGWPATPFHSIMRTTDKAQQLPSLPLMLKENGYSTAFFYGGESSFSNLRLYLSSQQFDYVTDKDAYNESLQTSRWGVPDEYVLKSEEEKASAEKQPFFHVVMTLSNHEPFDVPKTFLNAKDESDKFRNSCLYTDYALGNYFASVKKTSWFNNTLFVIVADHGHMLLKNKGEVYATRFHVPLLLYGNVLNEDLKGKRIHKTGNHHDIAATLLTQLSLHNQSFSWSKDLLDSSVNGFAYYQIEQVIGWIENNNWMAYSFAEKEFAAVKNQEDTFENKKMFEKAARYTQVLYDRYQRY